MSPLVNPPVIDVQQVVKGFGPIEALAGVSLSVHPGELFALIGHNGAGKSTLFKAMLGLIAVDRGEILIHGESVQGPHFRAVRRQVGYLPENVVFYDNLTGLETLEFFARLKQAAPGECGGLLARVGLADAAQRRVRTYSKGMRQRLGLAQALLGTPSLLFLDEPTTGLDPAGIREFYQILAGLREQGVTIILTSHILAEIQERADRLAMMQGGRITALGSVQALRESRDLPLRYVVQLRRPEDGAALHQALLPLQPGGLEVAGSEVRCHGPRHRKMDTLQVFARCASLIRDVQIIEPSLEDIVLSPTE